MTSQEAATPPDPLAAGCAWIDGQYPLPVCPCHPLRLDLYRATELFLTSTAGGVMPVATLDGRPVGDGGPGPVTMRIRDRYWARHRDPRSTQEVGYPAARTVGS